MVKHRWQIKSQKSDVNISHLQPTFSFSADRRTARTHIGGGGGAATGQFCGSRIHVNDLMCDWVFLGFPCFYQWWVIKHCSPPLSFRLIQKIFSRQTVTSCWKVEELNCDSMNFITASLLLQFLDKLVKDKTPYSFIHFKGATIMGLTVIGKRVCLPYSGSFTVRRSSSSPQ